MGSPQESLNLRAGVSWGHKKGGRQPQLLHGQANSLPLSHQGFKGGFRGVLACSVVVGRQCDEKTKSQGRADRQEIHHCFQEGAFQVVLVVKNLPVNTGDIRPMV